MSVEAYDALIAAAKEEIKNCKSLIKTINSLSESMSNCTSQLNCVASNLAQGLVIDGVSQGSGVADKANKIDSFRKNMDATVPDLNARITQLEADIEGWKVAKQALIDYLASLEAAQAKLKEKKLWQFGGNNNI